MPKPASGRVRKNYRLDPALIANAQAVLGTSTETETIAQALDLVAFRRETIDGVRVMAGAELLGDAPGERKPPSAGVGKGILRLAGTVPPADADAMLAAIEAACEHVDESGW